MKISSCYNCDSAERNFFAEENGFSLVKCAVCGVLYLDERPDDNKISQAHKQGKHAGLKELDVTGTFNPGKIKKYLGILDDIFKGDLGSTERWLDIGCGHGEFVASVRDYSNEQIVVRGTEPNVGKQKSAQKRGLDVGYFDLEEHGEKYDTISLLNVYSHLPDPPAFLRTLKRLLNPNGELILETGNAAEFSAEELDLLRPYYLPDHLSFASERIVVSILERLGFEIISVNKYPFPGLDMKGLAVEAVKVFLPGRESRIAAFLKRRKYSQVDMYVRARLKD